MALETVPELQKEVQRLQEEQQKLREQVKTAAAPEPAAAPRAAEETEGKEEANKPAGSFVHRHKRGLIIGGVILIVLLVAGYFLLRYFQSYESTDDAFIDGNLDPIGARISATVNAVYVQNDQFVKAGEVLVQLDPRDYQVAVEQARAAYNQAIAQIHAENPNVPITVTTSQTMVSTSQSEVISAQAGVDAAQQDYDARRADLDQAQAQNANAQANLERYRELVAKDEVSRQRYDAALATAKSNSAEVDAARDAMAAAQQTLDQRGAQLAQAQTRLAEAQTNAPRQIAVLRADLTTRIASAQAAKAALDRAELNLSYTKILAPVDGVVTSKTAEVGEHVEPGQNLLSISEVANVWVTANFKETQLRRMRPGQAVSIHVDAFDKDYQGYVSDMPGASGEATSLLPPENATGNFVKVVQRLPVRIQFKPGQNAQEQLRIGMSCEPKVWLGPG